METSLQAPSDTVDLSQYRVDRPDLTTYRTPDLDRWGLSYVDGQYHRCATAALTSADGLTSMIYVTTDDDRDYYRDTHSRCISATYVGTTSEYRPTVSDGICPVCAALDAVGPTTLDEPAAIVALADAAPFRMGANGSIVTGRAAVDASRSYSTTYTWSTVTVADVLAYWHHRHAAYLADLSFVGRTLRAAARSRGWEHHYETYIGGIDRPLPTAIRPVVDRRETMDVSDGLTVRIDPRGYVIGAPPATVHEIDAECCMMDVLYAVRSLETDHESTLEVLAEAFRTAAVDQSWCHEYEQTVADLNGGLSAYVSSPFLTRETNYRVEGTVTITMDVPWSTYVTAASAEEAQRMADVYDADVEDYLSGMRIDDLSYNVDYSSATIDDVTEDE